MSKSSPTCRISASVAVLLLSSSGFWPAVDFVVPARGEVPGRALVGLDEKHANPVLR
tara:strand:+ start:4780 stop:4950 length:171 start_codon:yes stop_codon:yes gene_type:complete